MKIPDNSILLEYPEFVLDDKRNFLLLLDVFRVREAQVEGYIRHGYHQPNLLFLDTPPKAIQDYIIHPLQQRFLLKTHKVLLELLRRDGKALQGSLPIPQQKIRKVDLGLFAPFTLRAAEITLKPLFYNIDLDSHQFTFWYTSLATTLQTSFSYLLTENKYLIDRYRILDSIKEYLPSQIDLTPFVQALEKQKVADVSRLYSLACDFLEVLGKRALQDIEQETGQKLSR